MKIRSIPHLLHGQHQARPPTTRAPANRLSWLDALRGIAALAVVFDHMIYTMGVFRPLRAVLGQWTALGQYGVFLFFLVSGYIVPVSLERKNNVRSFWVSRVFRLYPVYVVATAGLILLACFGMGSLAGARQRPVSTVLGHLLMMSGLLNAPNVPYTVWTLSYEMVFYLLITALFLARAQKRSDAYALGFAALTLAVGGILPGAAFLDSVAAKPVVDVAVDLLVAGGVTLAVIGRGSLRAAGAAVAAATALALVGLNRSPSTPSWQAMTIFALMFTGTVLYRAEHGQIGKRRAVAVVTGVFLLTVGGLVVRAHGGGHATGLARLLFSQRTWLTSLTLAVATFLAGLALRHRRVPPVLTWLGLVSYSVYLMHPLLLGIYRQVSWRPAGAPLEQAFTVTAFLATLLLLSSMTYRFVESPAQRLGKQAARRLESRSPRRSAPLGAARPGGRLRRTAAGDRRDPAGRSGQKGRGPRRSPCPVTGCATQIGRSLGWRTRSAPGRMPDDQDGTGEVAAGPAPGSIRGSPDESRPPGQDRRIVPRHQDHRVSASRPPGPGQQAARSQPER